jgi:hypothetical protein
MWTNPDFLMILANDHRRELIAEADRHRLLTAARRARRSRADEAHAAQASPEREKSRVARGQPAGTLTACGPHAAAPAR